MGWYEETLWVDELDLRHPIGQSLINIWPYANTWQVCCVFMHWADVNVIKRTVEKSVSSKYILKDWCKAVLSHLLTNWRYWSLALSHRFYLLFTLTSVVIPWNTDGLVQDCSIPSGLAMEVLQSCTKSWIRPFAKQNEAQTELFSFLDEMFIYVE